jgi:hypothetical protein
VTDLKFGWPGKSGGMGCGCDSIGEKIEPVVNFERVIFGSPTARAAIA